MARQFNLVNIRPSASGEHVTANITSDGADILEIKDAGVEIIWENSNDMLKVRFPASKLVMGSVLDLDR